MLSSKLFTIFKSKNYIIDTEKLLYYISFCLSNIESEKHKQSESHHILPKCLFPEYSNLKEHSWNKAELHTKNHIKAHYYLMEAIQHKSLIFSFNQMRRGLPKIESKDDLDILSLLYKEKRDLISQTISESNKGKSPSLETRKKLSAHTIGTAVFKYPCGDKKRLKLNHKDVLDGICIPVNIGIKKSEEFKLNMSIKLKNRKQYFNILTNTYELLHEDQVTEIHIKQMRSENIQTGKSFYGDSFYVDDNGKQIRSKDDLTQLGFKKGRINFGKDGNPFSNKSKVINVLDESQNPLWKNKSEYDYFDIPSNSKYLYCINSKYGLKVSHSEKLLKQFLHFDRLIQLLNTGYVTSRVSDSWLKDNHKNKRYDELGFKILEISNINLKVTIEELLNNSYEFIGLKF